MGKECLNCGEFPGSRVLTLHVKIKRENTLWELEQRTLLISSSKNNCVFLSKVIVCKNLVCIQRDN